MKIKKQHRPLVNIIAFSGFYLVLIYTIASLPATVWLRFTPDISSAIHLSNNVFIGCHIIVAILGIWLFQATLKRDAHWVKQHIIKTILFALLGMIAIIISGMLFIHGSSDNEQNLQFMMNHMTPLQLWLFQIVVVVIGPLNEEFMFREVIIGQCSHYLPKYILWIISSALFALIHIPNLVALPQALPYFVNGLIIGFVYIKGDNNVLCSYSLHLLNNLLSLIV